MRDYFVESEGKHLQEMNLTAPEAKTRIDDDENCDYVVGVQWLRVEPRESAVPYTGLQVWRGVVKRMGKGKTVDHLVKVFDAPDRSNRVTP